MRSEKSRRVAAVGRRSTGRIGSSWLQRVAFFKKASETNSRDTLFEGFDGCTSTRTSCDCSAIANELANDSKHSVSASNDERFSARANAEAGVERCLLITIQK